MMKTKNIQGQLTLSLIFILVFSSSCNSDDQQYSPVKNRKPRVSSLGFSIMPPPGENWFESFTDQSIHYTKKTNPKIQTFYTGATEIHTSKSFATAESFLPFVKEKKDVNEHPDRYQNSKSEYKIDKHFAPVCVSYNQTYEDHGAKNLGKNQFLLIENHGLICIHPNSTKAGVDVYYSDRYVPNKQKLSVRNEGAAFIKSLKFLPLNSK